MFKLYRGDCLRVMPTLAAASVDMVLADLPYGTTACQWDSTIPLDSLWIEFKRVCKPKAVFVFTASQPFTTALINSNPSWFKYEWIWTKNRGSGFVHAKNKPLKAHENILIFSSGTTVHKSQSANRMTYNPQMRNGTPYRRTPHRKGSSVIHKPTVKNLAFLKTTRTNEGTRYPISCLPFSIEPQSKQIHPTQKPVALMRYMIRTYTNPGAVVLDNTMGSGTTGVAALMEGRRFIGIESDPTYYAVAKERIELEAWLHA